MPKLIVTSRFLKPGERKNLSNYVKYIATRKGAVAVRENYVGYLANRPGSHGLFSQTDAPINLDAVRKEVGSHNGNVWTHVISLKRENAQAMGYDTLDAWRSLVRRQMSNIAKQTKIDLKNLRWYAAFHDKETNPHVHIVVYSADPKEGYLSLKGIEKIRSGFANDIYADELHNLYAEQTDVRNLLKRSSAKLMQELAEEMQCADFHDAELNRLIMKLHRQLKTAKGKKVYGYLKPEVKRTVDEIFQRLSQEPRIQEMYRLWCELEQAKHDVYSSARVEFPELAGNPVFHSVRNSIVRVIAGMGVAEENVMEPEVLLPSEAPKTFETEVSEPSEQAAAEAAFSILLDLCRAISEDYRKDEKQLRSQVDGKLRRVIRQRKLGLGIKDEPQFHQC